MAEPIKQEVLIDVQLEQDDAQFAKLAQLKGTLVGLKKEQRELATALKEGAITQKEYNAEIVRVEALQKRVQAEYNKTQRAVTGLKNPFDKLNDSIKNQTKAIQGVKNPFDKLNDSIKNQTKAIQGVVPGLDRMTGGAISAAGAIFQMVKASLAFLATPLGLVIAGVTVALAPFAAFLTQTGEGADLVSREMEGFRSVLQLVRDDLVKTGKEQKGFFQGLVESIVSTNPVLAGLVATYNGLAEAGRDYADVLDDIQDSQENFSIQASKDENQIKRLLLQAKNRTLSEQERIDLLNKALLLEEGIVTKNTEFAQKGLSAIVERNRARLEEIGIIQQAGETQEDFVANNIDAIRDFDEALAKSLIDSVRKLEEAKSSGIAIEEKAQNQLDALAQKEIERNEKKLESERKAAEERVKISNQEREQRIADFDAKMAEDEEALINQLELKRILAESVSGLDEQMVASAKRAAEARKKIDKETIKRDREKIESAQITASALTGIFKQGTVAYKLAASGQAAIDTYAAANAATKPPPVGLGPVAGIPLAILTVIRGLANVARINDVQFARGGYTGRGGVWEPAGVVHKGEVVWSQADVARAGGAEAVDRMRPTYRSLRPYATGGIVGNETRVATLQAQSQFDINQMAALINTVRTILVLDDLRAVENTVDSTKNRARVIG